MRKKIKQKVVVAMSGGVDSSVTAALLKEQGYECIGMHLNFWTDTAEQNEAAKNKCCTLGGLEDARDVSAKLDIPFYVMNVVDEFKQRVVDYFLETYSAGQTPNPCVECNRHIKFGELLKRAQELGADFLASGHYAKVAQNIQTEKYELFMPKDRGKDQTYFLYHLSQEKLKHILFPLGDLMKSEVYELAQKFGLIRVAEKPQSQGLCFFSEATPKEFLHRYLQAGFLKPGPIVALDGRKIGEHKGLPLYTIGQRQGLGIGGISNEPEGEPWYVVRIEPRINRLVVGRKEDIYHDTFVCDALSFISGEIPSGKQSVEVRIRHRGVLTPAEIEMKDERIFVSCKIPVCAVAAGQAAVFYKGEQLIGGATILEPYAKKETSQKTRARIPIAY
ncbi:tRNA 2-thiouridine(34) synthase MnmA [Candidatus Peregrinibacteria bacterium]|nr:tRNA 2-thiouridine(34) synthase MnmA [Candidatus Peregrinibacteria bacterium]